MELSAEKVYHQALDLPVEDRLALIDKLLQSANLPTREDVDQAWVDEVERRNQTLMNNTAKLIPGEEVFRKVKERFSR